MIGKDIKIAVYGAGAMGTVLGAFLTLGGLENVHLITRNEAHVRAMQEQGALIDCVADGEKKRVKVNALLPEEMGQYDVVFLMTKQRFNEETVNRLLSHLTEEGVICTTQNGLPERSVSKVLGTERTYGMAVSFGAELAGAGEVKLTSKIEAMSVELGAYQNEGAKLALLAEILAFAGKVSGNPDFVKKTDNLLGARWSKLAINSAFSGLSTLTGLTFGEIAKRGKTRKIALAILRECMAVANASGVQLAPMQGKDMQKYLGGTSFFGRFFAYIALPIAMKKHKNLTSGMCLDVKKGRKCEIDFVNGVVVEEGKRVGVPTPYNEKVVEIVHGIENGLYEMSVENVDFF